MMKRNVLNSPRLSELKQRRRRVFLNKALIYFFIFSATVTIATYLSRIPGINISVIESRGNAIVDSDAIRSVAERELSGKYLWLFPKKNVLIYPKGAIRRALAALHPRLREINLSVETGRMLLISVSEREPLYTWCGDSAPGTAEAETCYFLDKEGFVFDEAPYFSGDVYFKFYGASGVIPLYPQGSHFAPEYFTRLVAFKDGVAALGLKPGMLYLKDDGDAELFLAGSARPKILIKASADMEALTSDLGIALQTEPLKTRIKKEYGNLEYLDLRFENKVYSRFATD